MPHVGGGMYDDVLIPTDGSEAVAVAVERGIDLCERYGATAHALYVVQPLYTVDSGLSHVQDAMREVGQRALADVERQAEAAGVDCVTTLRTGAPHDAILAYVDDPGADLIVMGTHGRTGLRRFILGSVTERVVRISPVPVLTVRSTDGEDEED